MRILIRIGIIAIDVWDRWAAKMANILIEIQEIYDIINLLESGDISVIIRKD